MMLFTDLTGLLSGAIAAAALGMMFMPTRTSPRHRRWAGGVLFIALLLPWEGEPLAIYPRGVFGDLSITSTVLLLLAAANLGGLSVSRLTKGRPALLGIIALSALVFYPMALGVGMLDPYRFGYASLTFIVMVSAVAAWGLWTRRYLIAAVIALAMLAWSVGWYESNNLWDYLLDPLVALYAAGVLVKRGVIHLLRTKNNSATARGNDAV